jgi:hypothetical protein
MRINNPRMKCNIDLKKMLLKLLYPLFRAAVPNEQNVGDDEIIFSPKVIQVSVHKKIIHL